MKADVLFVGMQLFSRKRQKHARFMDGALKTWSIKNIEMLKLGWFFPPTKISGHAPGCHCYYLPKDRVFFFIWSMCWL